MRFEDKKFCQVRTLASRWDCSTRLIYDLVSRGTLKAWHPDGSAGSRGMRIEVRSVIDAEQNGFIDIDS